MKSTILLYLCTAAFTTGGDLFDTFEDSIADPPTFTGYRADSLAPIGVMGDHTHSAGRFMLSYRYMFMNMDGMRDGANDLGTRDIYADYPVAPTDMTMEMHMFGLMYGVTDRLTLMAMTNFQSKGMDHLTRPGSPPFMMRGPSFTQTEEGWGDLAVGGLWKLTDSTTNHFHLNLGVSIPTANRSPLPYPMQNGSGTWDLKPGLTWTSLRSGYSLGAQVMGTIRLDESHRGYRFPNQLDTSVWIAKPVNDWVSLSARLTYLLQGKFHGPDEDIRMFMSPQMDASNLPVDRLDLSLGVNIMTPLGFRLGLEIGAPVYEKTDGPRLSTEWWSILGGQFSF